MRKIIRVKETEDKKIYFNLYGQDYEVVVEKNKAKKDKDDGSDKTV